MGQESANAVQWMREMESATDALDFDLHAGSTNRQSRAGYCQTSGKPRRLRGVSQVGDPLRAKDPTLGRNLANKADVDHRPRLSLGQERQI
eukprot:4331161-Amphidinium_carterae.1